MIAYHSLGGLCTLPPRRDDPGLGRRVGDQLAAWAAGLGVFPDRPGYFAAVDIGRMAMLAYPGTDDEDRLLAAAKVVASWYMFDDTHVENRTADRLRAIIPLALAASDIVTMPGRYRDAWRAAVGDDPALTAVGSAFEHFARYSTPVQRARVRQEAAGMYIGMNAEANLHSAGSLPPAWQYLVCRQYESFLPCIALVDAIAGYELPPEMYSRPDVRRAVLTAGSVSQVLNDLYSFGEESNAEFVFSLPAVLAAEYGSTPDAVVGECVELHNELMAGFHEQADRITSGGPEVLLRFFDDVLAWLAGSHEWHAQRGRRFPTSAPGDAPASAADPVLGGT